MNNPSSRGIKEELTYHIIKDIHDFTAPCLHVPLGEGARDGQVLQPSAEHQLILTSTSTGRLCGRPYHLYASDTDDTAVFKQAR